MSFENLKKASQSNFEKLNKELEKLDSNKNFNNNDDRLWTPTRDSAGNGYAVIRFLPGAEGDEFPFVRVWDHGFQGPGGWYIEKSLSTIDKADPVLELNSKLWASTTDDESPERKQARTQKRRTSFYSNIYVVKDSAKPENEGKVFLFKYGKRIFNKIKEAMNPPFEDKVAFDPFDLWSGATFKLKIRKVEGYPNYDLSEFETPAPLFESDEELKKVYDAQHSLSELIDPKNFKSYDELKKRLDRVLGIEDKQNARREETRQEIRSESAPSLKEDAPPFKVEDDDEDDDAFFKSLIED